MTIILLTVIFFAFVSSVIKYPEYKNTIFKYFSFLLGITLVTEIVAVVLRYYILIPNSVVYNIFIPIVNLFYLQFYKQLFKSKKNQKLMDIFSVLFVLTYLAELLVVKRNFLDTMYTYSLVTGAIFILITLILFLIEIINNEKIINNIHKSLIFWISTGSLLFYVGIIPMFIVSSNIIYPKLYTYIVTILNVVMYGTFTIGYFVSNPKNNI